MNYKITLLATLFLFTLGCKKQNNPDCKSAEFTSEDMVLEDLTIQSVVLDGDCLNVTYSASGCSGDTWNPRLMASESVLESNPPQRRIWLTIDNNELCEALITTEVCFNIENLRTSDGNKLSLDFQNNDETLLYKY